MDEKVRVIQVPARPFFRKADELVGFNEKGSSPLLAHGSSRCLESRITDAPIDYGDSTQTERERHGNA